MDFHQIIILATFSAVYIGMAAGRWPGLAIDRTGIALCGAILLLLVDQAPGKALERIDFGAIAILFGLMVMSAQFAAAGFYDWCAARLAASRARPHVFLALVIVTTGALSSVLANDVVVFAMTPILCRGLLQTGRDPRPFAFGLAGAANVGSAATLVGNPQNILIGEHATLDFWDYLFFAAPLSVAGLVVVYLCVALVWHRTLLARSGSLQGEGLSPVTVDRAALIKGIVAVICLLGLYATDWPRWQSTMLIAGILLISRRLTSREMLAAVDWHLLVLLGSLFIVTGAPNISGLNGDLADYLARYAIHVDAPLSIGIAAIIGSNTVGNVPFVILALAGFPELSRDALHALAVLSTFAGNLLIVGSLANLIVAERCRAEGVVFGFKDHLRAGLPMTLLTLIMAIAWIEIM